MVLTRRHISFFSHILYRVFLSILDGVYFVSRDRCLRTFFSKTSLTISWVCGECFYPFPTQLEIESVGEIQARPS